MFFPLWKIESLEEHLEKMEANGYQLDHVEHSYCFHFKETTPKEACYFLTYKSFRGASMAHWDYSLLSEHKANEVKTKMCFYSMYRTKEPKENLSFLSKARMDYIKRKLLQNALGSLFITTMFAVPFYMSIITGGKNGWLGGTFTVIGSLFTAYYSFGYFKQRNKCKKHEKNRLN